MPVVRRRPWLFALFSLFLFTALSARADLILSSAPRDTEQKEQAIFKPIADLLGRAVGQRVTFRWGDNFLVYQSEMRKGTYDIILDGPAFIGWRMANLQHEPLVKFPGNLVFAVVVKKDENRIRDLKDLAGRTICSFPPPNLATLTVLYEFDNPARQPLIIETQTFPEAYQGVLAGKCTGAILQAKLYQDLDRDAKAMKVVFTSKPLPNQGFSAGPRVTPAMREKMATALLSPEGMTATQALRDVYKAPTLLPAVEDEYKGLGRLLRDVWGFN